MHPVIRLIQSFAFGILVLLCLQGCSAIGHDNREKIARATLYGEKGALDTKTFASALYEKFSRSSSPLVALNAYVESLEGKCFNYPNEKDLMRCSIPESSTICVDSRIELLVATSSGNISNITAQSRVTGC